MSPESYRTADSLEQKAQEIKNVLIKHETIIQSNTHNDRQARIPHIKADLDITEVSANISDLVDKRIRRQEVVFSPEFLTEVLPISEQSAQTTRHARKNIERSLEGEDDRMMVLIGPCSIHDTKSALEYADWISEMRNEFGNDLEIVMRFYPEKPRTVTGWKGLTYDPHLTEFFDPANPKYDHALGLIITRMLLNRITHIGAPTATERLNTSTPQYINGLVAYDAIGARNSLDSNARAYLSGSSANGGLKHPPDGSIELGLDGVEAATHPLTMLGNTMTGVNAEIQTKGNNTAHLILRGGTNVRNFSGSYVAKVKQQIALRNEKKDPGHQLLEAVVIDASHANSLKDYTKQIEVIQDVAQQVSLGETAIKGVMIESNLVEGSQKPPASGKRSDLIEGKSITDGCVGLDESERMLSLLATSVQTKRAA